LPNNSSINTPFYQNLAALGFEKNDDALYLVNEEKVLPDPQIKFHIEIAKDFKAAAVYLRKQLNGSYKPQVYLFDFTDQNYDQANENTLTDIQKIIWTSGEAPLACIFYKTEIKILDCTTHISKDYTPVYLIDHLKLTDRAHHIYNKQFAIKIKSGIFWEEDDFKNKFKFQNSSYDILIENIRFIIADLQKKYKAVSKELINKLIVQAILIKYLEERIDDDGNKLLSDKYFKKYEKATTFNEVLEKGRLVELLNDLNDPKKGFNGNVFKWTEAEQQSISKIDLTVLAKLLQAESELKTGQQTFPGWRLFEFKYIPVELISRLYEEFLGEDKKSKGMYYTPSHLAKLLVDESIPLKKYQDIDLANYEVLDPACGSGIFLVIAFKRLVQIWRLQNNMNFPTLEHLKPILLNIYGVDKEEQAVNLASFSLCLALCHELQPLDIINKLKFDDLREKNLIKSDFFDCPKLNNRKFDLVIGNPPFVRGGTKDFETKTSKIEQEIVEIPNNQIALKFLADAYGYLKMKGLQCLIIKSSGLIYNTTSSKYVKVLFSKTNVIQILDFTGLARNKALWDNKQGSDNTPLEVDTAAIFIRKEEVDFKKNILHLTFRRTKATKDRIVFEIDDYDLHFVNRATAIENPHIWKYNLLGGGRIKNVLEKLSSIPKLVDYLDENKNTLLCAEGTGGAKSLPNEAFLTNGISQDYLSPTYLKSFENKKDKAVFAPPNLLIKKNIDLPYSLNHKKIKFSNEVVGFHSKDESQLQKIAAFIKANHLILQFFNMCTSGKMLVYKNTACKKEDILGLPFKPKFNLKSLLSEIDHNIISDVSTYMQKFLRNGENSKAVKPIMTNDFESYLNKYGKEFASILNIIYENGRNKFRLSDVVKLESNFIATIFKYDDNVVKPQFHRNNDQLNLNELTNIELSKHLSSNRIIKIYPQKDTIVFIKPNQYRYWLSLAAYRDADKCFADLQKAGY
jgi:methylase of polypeptide subunit release factors